MQAVVPAAGEGRRLRPLTANRPKGLVPVSGRPLLAHCFDALVELGVTEIVTVVGYRGDQIVEHFGDSYRGTPLRYVEQEGPNGLADAVLQAETFLDGDFVQLNGDNVLDVDLRPFVDHHRSTGASVTAMVEETTPGAAMRTGVVEFDDEDAVDGVVEKPDDPPSRTVLTGFYVFSPVVFDAIRSIDPSARGELELAEAIDLLARRGHRIETLDHDGWRVNVNRPEDVEATEALLRGETSAD